MLLTQTLFENSVIVFCARIYSPALVSSRVALWLPRDRDCGSSSSSREMYFRAVL